MDDAADTRPAATMGMMIVVTAGAVRFLHALLSRRILQRTQAWRRR